MKMETLDKLKGFNSSINQEILLSKKYSIFNEHLRQVVSGEGMIGENNYLFLWEKNEVEELNEAYEVQEFLDGILLIGTDGGDMAYGIDTRGRYIEVPFIGMNDKIVEVIAKNFDEFINYVWNKE